MQALLVKGGGVGVSSEMDAERRETGREPPNRGEDVVRYRNDSPSASLRRCRRRRLHLPKPVHDARIHDQEHPSTRTQPQHLRQEALIQRRKALLSHHRRQTRPRPVILGHTTGHLGTILDARLDDIHGGVEDGADRAADGAGQKIRAHRLRLVARRRLRHQTADLEDTAKVAGVPEDVAPQGGFQPVVQGQGPLRPDRLRHAVQHARVPPRRGAVLHADLDQLEGHYDEGLGRARGRAGEDGERLVRLLHAEEVAVEEPPRVVGREFGRAFGRLHADRRRDAPVQTREAFVLDDLAETVHHARVVVLAGDGMAGL